MENKKVFNQAFLEKSHLIENIQGGIICSDFEPPFYLRYATEGMSELSGYSLDELMTMEQADIVHPNDLKVLMKEVEEQLSVGNVFEVEYRLKKKNGSFVEVLDRAKVVTHDDGSKYIHCLLTDISAIKEMEKEVKFSQEKLKIAVFQSGNVIFELNPRTQEINFSENFESIFEQSIPDGKITTIIDEWVCEDYKTKVYDLLDRVANSVDSQSEEIKLKNIIHGEVWTEVNITAIRNERNELFAFLGILKNINEQRKEHQKLIDLSQKDSLTDIYNRSSMEIRVNDKLTTQGALIILDIDFFKQINDNLGHAYGDEILIKLTRTIEKLLPEDALFGRLGGDEFLIYLERFSSDADVENLLCKLMEQVRRIVLMDGRTLTVSLGTAKVEADTKSFDSLYKKADIALYRSKDKGRNCFSIY